MSASVSAPVVARGRGSRPSTAYCTEGNNQHHANPQVHVRLVSAAVRTATSNAKSPASTVGRGVLSVAVASDPLPDIHKEAFLRYVAERRVSRPHTAGIARGSAFMSEPSRTVQGSDAGGPPRFRRRRKHTPGLSLAAWNTYCQEQGLSEDAVTASVRVLSVAPSVPIGSTVTVPRRDIALVPAPSPPRRFTVHTRPSQVGAADTTGARPRLSLQPSPPRTRPSGTARSATAMLSPRTRALAQRNHAPIAMELSGWMDGVDVVRVLPSCVPCDA